MPERTGRKRVGLRQVALGLLSAITFFGGASLALGPERIELLQPHLGAPAILRPGDALRIELLSSIPFRRPELTVELSGPAGDYRLAVSETRRSPSGSHVSILAALPPKLPDGGFDLRVATSADSVTRPRAVQVVQEFPEQLKLLQLADLPLIGDQGAGDAQMRAIVDEINLIAPDLVLISGDLIYIPDEQCYLKLVDYLQRLEAPVVLAPGNHDYQSWGLYLRHFVRSHHVVDFGGVYVVTLNTGHRHDQVTRSQFRWLRQVMADRPGDTPVLQTHYPLFGPSSIKSLAIDIAQEMVEHAGPVALSGHLHHDAVFDSAGRRRESWDFPGPKFSVTGPAGAQDLREEPGGEFSYPGYRLVTLAAGEVLGMSYDADGDGVRDAASSYPFGRLRATSPEPGTVMISNELNEPISRARVRIVAPGNELGLRPDRGKLLRVIANQNSTVYSMEIDLPANSLTVLRLEEPETS